jgi:hypothetical protein
MRGGFASLVLSLLFCFALADGAAGAERATNDLEHAYIALALDMESHEVCAKISPRSVTRAPFNSPGTRTYFARSRCFQTLASRTRNAYFCRWVKPAAETPRDGAYFTRENCESLVREGKVFRASISFDHELVLKALGYTDEDVARRIPEQPEVNSWMLFYFDSRYRDAEMQQRLKNLPDFSAD